MKRNIKKTTTKEYQEYLLFTIDEASSRKKSY